MIDRLAPENLHIKSADNRFRGYLRMEITPRRITTDLRGMESVAAKDSGCSTIASFAVEEGRPGPQKA
jgi:alkaline phosphatase D